MVEFVTTSTLATPVGRTSETERGVASHVRERCSCEEPDALVLVVLMRRRLVQKGCMQLCLACSSGFPFVEARDGRALHDGACFLFPRQMVSAATHAACSVARLLLGVL